MTNPQTIYDLRLTKNFFVTVFAIAFVCETDIEKSNLKFTRSSNPAQKIPLVLIKGILNLLFYFREQLLQEFL